jgi:hypothetical protein
MTYNSVTVRISILKNILYRVIHTQQYEPYEPNMHPKLHLHYKNHGACEM